MEKKNKIILIGCIIFVCVAAAVMVFVNQDAKKAEEGKRLPGTTKEAVKPFGEFEVTDLDGKEVDKSIFQEADVTMVNVWATFCNPCLEEMPYLAELSKEYDSKNVQIIGLCLDTIQPDGKVNEENVSLAKEAVAATGADYLHLIPSMELYVGLYEYVPGVPTTFFVDQEGKLLGETVTGAKSKEDWAALLEEKLAMIQGEK